MKSVLKDERMLRETQHVCVRFPSLGKAPTTYHLPPRISYSIYELPVYNTNLVYIYRVCKCITHTHIQPYLCGALHVVDEGVEGAVYEDEKAHFPQMDLYDEDEVRA